MPLRTLSSASLSGKRVLVRVDYNVPIQAGKVQDFTRIQESLPTLLYLKEQGAKVVLMSHLGRPKGVDEGLRLDPIAQVLTSFLSVPVQKLKDCVGLEVEATVAALKPGDFVLLENLRFHPEEERNDPHFAATLARLGEVYVNDAFGSIHRAHASTEGVAHLLPSYAGFLVEKEVKILSRLMENPQHPLCLLIGGAKIDTKIGILEKFLGLADTFIIGGALANTFLKAQGYDVGTSLFEADKIGVAQEFLRKVEGKTVLLPVDVVASGEISEQASVEISTVNEVRKDLKILDLGPETVKLYADALKQSQTILWNGPMGLYEMAPFAAGTKAIAEAVAQSGATTILGGGDTLDALHHFGFNGQEFTHVSTGGGAMLEFLEGKILPGIQVLLV